MFSLMPFHPGSRLFVTCLVGALALGLAGAMPGFASPVTGLQMSGPDLEVFLSGPLDGELSAVLVDAAGVQVAEAPVSVQGGMGSALLAGAVAAIPAHGPAYRVTVVDGKGLPLGAPFPFLVALRCPPGASCRFQLLPGLDAPATVLVDSALGRALDALPAGTPDLLAAAVADDPALHGAALTAAWTWATLPPAPPGTCGCFWTLEAALPSDTRDGGAAVAVGAREAQGEEARLERTRGSSLELRQRCARAELRPGAAVTVADGEWSTLLTIPRVVLDGCAAACSPEVSWETEVKGWARALGEGGGDEAAAAVSWQAALTVDGAETLVLEDELTSAAGLSGGESERRASWSGDGERVALRAAARAEVAAPEGAADAEAVAAVAWRLVGQGISDCGLAGEKTVSLVSSSRINQGAPVQYKPGEPGQIGLLTSVEKRE